MSRRFGLTIDRSTGTVVPSGRSSVVGARSASVDGRSRRAEVLNRQPDAQFGQSRRAEIRVLTRPSAVFQSVATGIVSTSDLIIQNFIATPSVLMDKLVQLEYAPRDPLEVGLHVFGGIEQKSGVDFAVTGNILSWNGLALELLLEPDAPFTIQYLR